MTTAIVDNPNTLPGWEGLDLRSALEHRFELPVVVENDANAAALGEWWRGGGEGARRLAAVTLGTGIGVGFVTGGEVQRGADGRHGEAGHQLLDPNGPSCYCGARGGWEVLASGRALVRLAHAHGLEVTAGPDIAAAAERGDAAALAAFDELGMWVGRGIVNLIAIYAPDVIVLSGSVAEAYPLFGRRLAGVLAEHAALVPTSSTRVAPARTGPDAGLLGAAFLAIRADDAAGFPLGPTPVHGLPF